MALNTDIAYTTAAAMVNAITPLLDTGTGAIINIYDGTQPTECETAPDGTLLATLAMNATAFQAAADQNPNARIAANAIASDTSAAATGTAQYFRVYSTAATQDDAGKVACFIQGSVGTSTSDLILDSTAIAVGGTVAISSYYITMPELTT